jgi:hypothetical protein
MDAAMEQEVRKLAAGVVDLTFAWAAQRILGIRMSEPDASAWQDIECAD